jgi:hypothetical protein
MSSRKQFDPGPASDSTERLRSDNATKPLRLARRFHNHEDMILRFVVDLAVPRLTG